MGMGMGMESNSGPVLDPPGLDLDLELVVYGAMAPLGMEPNRGPAPDPPGLDPDLVVYYGAMEPALDPPGLDLDLVVYNGAMAWVWLEECMSS